MHLQSYDFDRENLTRFECIFPEYNSKPKALSSLVTTLRCTHVSAPHACTGVLMETHWFQHLTGVRRSPAVLWPKWNGVLRQLGLPMDLQEGQAIPSRYWAAGATVAKFRLYVVAAGGEVPSVLHGRPAPLRTRFSKLDSPFTILRGRWRSSTV